MKKLFTADIPDGYEANALQVQKVDNYSIRHLSVNELTVPSDQICEWKLLPSMNDEFDEVSWQPTCKEGDSWEYPPGEDYTDEIVGYRYCPFCGKLIKKD